MPGGPERRAALKKASSSLVVNGPERKLLNFMSCCDIDSLALNLLGLAPRFSYLLQPVDKLFAKIRSSSTPKYYETKSFF